MDMYKLKFTKLEFEIIRLLCIKAGEKLTQRKISKLLEVSPTAITKIIPTLEKEKFVKKEPRERTNYISLNRSNKIVLAYKRTENLRLIYESGLAAFFEETFPGCTIILFGSYSRGDDTTKSDIDIAIIGSKIKKTLPKKFEQCLERRININNYSTVKGIHKHLRENILNGITLFGGIEL